MRRLTTILLIPLIAAPAIAQPTPGQRQTIEIGSPDFRPYPMAIPEARDMSGKAPSPAAQEITDALRWDFTVAAMFKTLDPKGYLADPAKEGLAAASIKFSDWVNVGAEGLLKCGVTVNGATLKADFRFFDVASGRQLLQKTYTGKVEDARRFAHTFADAVVEELTKQKGIFRTRIAAVKKTKKGLELFSPDDDSAAVVTAARMPEGIDGRTVIRTLAERHGITMEGGRKALTGKIVRIGHIGYMDVFDVTTSLAALELALAEEGAEVERGAAVPAALEAYGEPAGLRV